LREKKTEKEKENNFISTIYHSSHSVIALRVANLGM